MNDDDTAAGERAGEEPLGVAELVREHYAPALRHAARLLRDTAEAAAPVRAVSR